MFDKPISPEELVTIVRTIHHRWLAKSIPHPTVAKPVSEDHPIYTVLSPWP